MISLNLTRIKKSLRQDLSILLGLWLLCLTIGFLINRLRAESVNLTYQRPAQRLEAMLVSLSATDEIPGELREISLDTMKLAVNQKKMILDARPNLLFRVGHIPGAINLSREQFSQDFEKLKDSLDSNRNLEIIVYCSGMDCEDSGLVARALKRLKFTKVCVFREGWEVWENARLPQERIK